MAEKWCYVIRSGFVFFVIFKPVVVDLRRVDEAGGNNATIRNVNTTGLDPSDEALSLVTTVVYCTTELFLLASAGLCATSTATMTNLRPIFLCHLGCLLVAYPLIVIVDLARFQHCNALCFLAVVTKRYAFLASFTWLTVLSFDNWRRFRSLKSLVETETAFNGRLFLKQCCFGWGFPLLCCSVAFALDLKRWDINSFLYSVHGFIPMGFLLMCVITFCLLTVKNIRQLGKDVADVNPEFHKAMFRISLKLILVMGTEHVLCFITFVLASQFGGRGIGWKILKIGNGFTGVFIFLVYLQQMKPSGKNIALFFKRLFRRQQTEENQQNKGKS